MRALYLLLMLVTVLSLTSCKSSGGGARFIPHNPLTFHEDSLKAAGLGVTLSKLNEALVIAHPVNGGKVTIKNSFNSVDKSKDKSKQKADVIAEEGATTVLDQTVNKDKSKVKADIIGDGNSQKESESYWWVLIPIGLVIVVIWLYKKVKR